MKRREELYVATDSRNRITIPKKIAKNIESYLYKIYEKDGKIILEPLKEIPDEERWLFDPKNKAIVEELKKALKLKANQKIDLREFEED